MEHSTARIVGIYGMIFVLSIGFQSLHATGPVTAGLLFLPIMGGLAVDTRLGSRLLRSYRPHWLLVGGHFVAALGALALAESNISVLSPLLAAPLMVIGLGAGTTTPAMSLSILDSVDRSQSGLASGLLNGARQSGGVIGVALLGSLLGEPATFAGMRWAFFVAAGALALASIVAFSAWRPRTEARNADRKEARSDRGASSIGSLRPGKMDRRRATAEFD